jgi:RHS repeat-associated protein
MSYDRMGRRVTKNDQRFVYDGYLQIANSELQTPNSKLQTFIWDPTEPIATRPLAWLVLRSLGEGGYYTHDGNKNVSDLVFFNGGSGVAAHYEYAPFGALTASTRNSISTAYDFRTYNPFRFSSEYADDALGLVYYNCRHYDSALGRWLVRDPIGESVLPNIYGMCFNQTIFYFDVLGLKVYWSARDLDSFFLGNHHFITFAYDDPEDAFAELRSRLIKVTCKNCKTKYVMFMGLERLPPVTENVERSFLGIKWQTTKEKRNIGVYQLDANNFPSSDHKNDLQAYKEDFCKERGFWSDFDYDAHEIIGYSDENEFVSELLKLYKRSEKNLKDKPVEYDLRKRNCATWVNCILKEAGISDDDRAKINLNGIDWGEGQETLEEWFK